MIVRTLQRLPRLALVVGAVGALWALTATFPHSWPRGLVVQGATFGAASGLLAVGLVLTYQTTRVINFSYGAMGACAAQVGVVAYQRHGLPWAVSVLLAIVAGGLFGLVVDRVFRRFGRAPRIIVTVATVGLVQVFVGLQFAVAFWSGATTPTPQFATGLSDHQQRIGTTVFTGNDLVAAALVPLALLGLSWFLLRTEAGTAVRALADNRERAMLLGVPVRRLSRLTWLLVGSLAAAVLVLNAPMNGVPASPFVSAGGVFLPALAAAVVARMERLSVAFAVGVALGVFNAVVSNNVHKTALGTVAMLVVVLAALLAQRKGSSRADIADSSVVPGSSRPLPPALNALPVVRWGRAALLVILGVVAVGFPLVAGPSRVHTVTGDVVIGITVVSLVVLAGWSGTISLGQYAIVGVGAVVAGNLMARHNLDLFVVLVLAAGAGALISLLVGLPALRVRPLFLAVTTFAFAAAMDQYFLDPSNYPDLIPGTVARPVLWERFPLESENATYYLCIGALFAVVIVAWSLRRSRPGRVLLASRDNERAAGAMTVAVTRVRLAGMATAGMIAGIAGALTVVLEGGVGASSFPAETSVLVFSIAVVGGLSSISGALLGVVVVELLTFAIGETTSQPAQFATLGTGVLLVGILLVFPGGLGQAVERLRDAVIGRITRRRGIGFGAGAREAAAPPPPPTVQSLRAARRRPCLLSCRAVTASYGPMQVLFGVDFDVAEGEIVALLGTNGAGKSTLFRTFTELLRPTSGDIRFDGVPLRGLSTDSIARLGLGVMPGDRGVFPGLTVAENLQVACWQLRRGHGVDAARDEVLDMFPILRERATQLAGNLSGGEQQQLSLAMAFVAKPRLLLIDELSLGLAPTVVGMLCEKVAQIHRSGTTIVLVEQSVSVALQLAERAVFIDKGTIRFEGNTSELLHRPDLLRSVFIGGSAPQPAGVAGPNGHASRVPARQRGTDLVCRGIVKRFGGITAIDDVDLTIAPGRIVGLIGHNGAGKTTLFDVVSGFQKPDGGRVLLGGRDITDLAPHRRAIGGLGRSFQEARLYPSLSVIEAIVVALDRRLGSRGWVASGLALPASIDAEFQAFRRAEEVVELLGLGDYASTPIADLSTGTRRIVELACVLAMDPAVVLLDEPSAGVAQRDTEALGPLLRRVKAETGSAILIIEHDMALLSSLCDELVALELGRVICTGPPDAVLAHPQVIESYLGSSAAVAVGTPHNLYPDQQEGR